MSASELRQLCISATHALPASGVAVSLMAPGEAPVLAAASDSEASVLEDLQTVLGEGPCLVAFEEQRPVLVADLGDGAVRRWPAYSSAAQELGVRAVFAFPLQVGAARLGVLDVYRS